MNKSYRHLLSLLLVPTLMLTFFAMSALVNAPSAHAATRDVQNSDVPNDPGGPCAPATTYDWTYTASAYLYAYAGGPKVATAQATDAADFQYNGSCGTPSITFKDCNYGTRALVASPASSCEPNITGDVNEDVWVIGDNAVVYQGVTICNLTVQLGSDEFGDYNTGPNTNCNVK